MDSTRCVDCTEYYRVHTEYSTYTHTHTHTHTGTGIEYVPAEQRASVESSSTCFRACPRSTPQVHACSALSHLTKPQHSAKCGTMYESSTPGSTRLHPEDSAVEKASISEESPVQYPSSNQCPPSTHPAPSAHPAQHPSSTQHRTQHPPSRACALYNDPSPRYRVLLPSLTRTHPPSPPAPPLLITDDGSCVC